MSYIIYMKKESAKDNWENGEDKLNLIYDYIEVTRGDDLKTLLNNVLNDIKANNDDNFDGLIFQDEESSIISYGRTENEEGDNPTESQIANWKEGKIDLYAAYYSILIKEVNIITRDKVKELIKIF